MKLQEFNYNGNPVTFQLGNGDVMVNATQMAKPFSKRTSKYLELPSTKEFLSKLSAVRKSDRLIKSVNGVGTWMHEDVAIDFAQWLSVEFRIWCNDRIKELLKHGITATPQKIEDMLSDPNNWIKTLQALQTERIERERYQAKSQLQEEQLQIQAPKVIYFNNVLQSKSTYTTNQIAKEFGMSARRLNKLLHDLKIQYKQNDTWLLYHKYQNKDYTKTKTHHYYDSNVEPKTSMLTVWTESGRLFIHDLLKESHTG